MQGVPENKTKSLYVWQLWNDLQTNTILLCAYKVQQQNDFTMKYLLLFTIFTCFTYLYFILLTSHWWLSNILFNFHDIPSLFWMESQIVFYSLRNTLNFCGVISAQFDFDSSENRNRDNIQLWWWWCRAQDLASFLYTESDSCSAVQCGFAFRYASYCIDT